MIGKDTDTGLREIAEMYNLRKENADYEHLISLATLRLIETMTVIGSVQKVIDGRKERIAVLEATYGR